MRKGGAGRGAPDALLVPLQAISYHNPCLHSFCPPPPVKHNQNKIVRFDHARGLGALVGGLLVKEAGNLRLVKRAVRPAGAQVHRATC